jgi:hypothetical protein
MTSPLINYGGWEKVRGKGRMEVIPKLGHNCSSFLMGSRCQHALSNKTVLILAEHFMLPLANSAITMS